jgi:tetratricopeptide (TPR) repeat protein
MSKQSRKNNLANPEKIRTLFSSAVEFLQSGDFKSALARLKKADKLAPSNYSIMFNLGATHQQLGMFREASGFYKRCVVVKPEQIDLWQNLARCCRDSRQFQESIKAYKVLIRLGVISNDELNDLATVYGELGNFKESVKYYDMAFTKSPENPVYQLNLAMSLVLNGETERAETLYRNILEFHSIDQKALLGLAGILDDQQRIDDLEPVLIKLYGCYPTIDYCVRLGNCQTLLGKSAIAKETFKSGLEIDSQNPTLLTNLGVLYSIEGERELAEDYMRRALIHDPLHVDAWRHLSGLKKYEDCGHPDVRALQSLLGKKLAAQSESALHFTLGKIFDDCGRFDQALSHYEKGNHIRRATLNFDIKLLTQHVDRIRSVFTPELLSRASLLGDGEDIALIVGLPRSGTTLLEQMLSADPSVHPGGEMLVINQLVQKLESTKQDPYPELCKFLDDKEISGFSADTALAYRSVLESPTQRLVIDKMPFNFFHLGLIHMLLPGVKIIECQRNLLDTCLSAFFNWFPKGMDYTYSYKELAQFCRIYFDIMDHWRNTCKIPIHTVNYERLVAFPDEQLKPIFSTLGLHWNSEVLNFYQQGREVRTISAWQVRKPLNTNSVGRINNYDKLMVTLSAELKNQGL